MTFIQIQRKFRVVSLLGLCFLSIASCKEEAAEPLEDPPPIAVVPETVHDVKIENLPGGAQISYTIPLNNNIDYVQAEYKIRDTVNLDIKAMSDQNFLIVTGFDNTGEHLISLYAVDSLGNKSEPVEVKIKPLKSPLKSAFETLSYLSTPEGVHVTFDNPNHANYIVNVLIKNQYDQWAEHKKYNTNLQMGDVYVVGLPAEPTSVGIYLSDQWSNFSDTLVQEITPAPTFNETLLDKGQFSILTLPGAITNNWNPLLLWDDKPTSSGGFTALGTLPYYFEFSLGSTVKLSRLKIWGIFDGREYSSHNIKEFEVWGSADPNPDGSYDGWTLLQTFTVVKPSGLPPGELSDADRALAASGFEFNITSPSGKPSIKHIRINIISTFATASSERGNAWVREITLWGEKQP